MHSDSAAALAAGTYSSPLSGMYPRVAGVSPYDTAWHYNLAAAQAQSTLKSQETASTNAAAQTAALWSSMHSATSNWLSAAETAANQAASLQLPVHTKTVSPTDYAAGFTSFSSNPAASYLSTAAGHNLLGDTYKSMLPSPTQNTIPCSVSSAFLPRPGGGGGAGGLGGMGLGTVGAGRAPRAGRGYAGRSACDCPNCQEADRLGPAGANFRRNIHSCHIPGCGTYNSTRMNKQNSEFFKVLTFLMTSCSQSAVKFKIRKNLLLLGS